MLTRFETLRLDTTMRAIQERLETLQHRMQQKDNDMLSESILVGIIDALNVACAPLHRARAEVAAHLTPAID